MVMSSMAPASLPFVTADLPGTGGTIKAEPDHFVVEEVPLYPPAGHGEHLFVALTRSGRTTREVVAELAAYLQVRPDDIGYAGLKDRQARVTQVFSLPRVRMEQIEAAARALALELHWATPHPTKLRPGHLLGNRFTITVMAPEAPERAAPILEALQQRGLPNFFGAQRFGRDGDNAERGLAILTGRCRAPGEKWLTRLFISAYQAQLFNAYLTLRLQRGLFDRLLPGDLAKKTDTGGMFIVADAEAEQPRFARGEITFTGPIFGYDMWAPTEAAAALEAEILATTPVRSADWRRWRAAGNRRPGRLFLRPVELTCHPDRFILRFFLPKGAYATVLLREVLKVEPGTLDEESEA